MSDDRTHARRTGADSPSIRAAVVAIMALFIATRLIVIAVAALVEAQVPLVDPTNAFSGAPILTSLTTSDAVYYLGIARDGYHLTPVAGPYHDYVFFPLFPILVRAASILTFGNVELAGVLVANAATLGAMAMLYRLSVPRLGHEDALRAVAFLVIAPGAVAFAMAYSDSLFLLLALGAFGAVVARRDAAVGILYGLATLTRLPGIVLGIALLMALIARDGRRPTPSWLWLAVGPIFLGLFSAFLWQFAGDPLAFLHGQAAWQEPRMSPVQGGSMDTRAEPLFLILFAILLAYTFMLVYLRTDRVPAGEAALAIVILATVLLSGRILSAPRYLAIAWPYAGIQAARGSPWFRAAWPILLSGLFALFAFLHFTTTLAP